MSEESKNNGATGNESTDRHMEPSLVNSLPRYGLPPVLWMGVIFILSAQRTLPEYPDTLLDSILKKAAHIIEYGILAFLLQRALSRGQGALSRPALIASFVVSVLYAASDEYHQTFVPGRNGTLMDVGFDTVGALVALLFVGSLRRKRERGDTPR